MILGFGLHGIHDDSPPALHFYLLASRLNGSLSLLGLFVQILSGSSRTTTFGIFSSLIMAIQVITQLSGSFVADRLRVSNLKADNTYLLRDDSI